jgi:hypothetical protein
MSTRTNQFSTQNLKVSSSKCLSGDILNRMNRCDSRDSPQSRGIACNSVVQTAILLAVAVICLRFDPNDARRQVWNGEWPGEEDCERLGFYSNGDPDFPDLNHLFTDCVWDADTQR